jgi:hypothetical protein
LDDTRLSSDLMRDALRKCVLDMPDGSLSAVNQGTNYQNGVHWWLQGTTEG